MKYITNLKEKLSGKKTYALITFAMVAILGQFFFDVDMGVDAYPPATDVMDLIEQLYGFFIAGTLRAAIK